MSPSFVIYTYDAEGGEEVCHVYGPTDQTTAETVAQKLLAKTPGLGIMVLPLEALPS